MSIEAQGITFRRGRFSLNCDRVSIPEGSVTGIIGKNGSGKSTLLKILNGALKAERGTVKIRGNPLDSISLRDLSRNMAFVQQEITDPLGFTVREVMAVSGYSRDSDESAMMSALRQCEIEELADRKFSDLSGGERRLVTLAAALYQDSAIMLLDEPTTFLDVDNEILIHHIIRSMKEAGKTVVVVMHNLESIYELADRIVIMKNGTVVAQGETGSVMTKENLSEAYGVDFDVYPTPEGMGFSGRRRAHP